MPITRDPDYPEETAQLMAIFSACADGFDLKAVTGAAANMLMACIKAKGELAHICDDHFPEFAKNQADQLSADIAKGAIANWKREPRADDIEVKVH